MRAYRSHIRRFVVGTPWVTRFSVRVGLLRGEGGTEMKALEGLLAVVLVMVWVICSLLSIERLQKELLPGVRPAEGFLWFLDTIDATRLKPSGRKWIRVVIFLHTAPFVAFLVVGLLMQLFWRGSHA